MDMAEERETGWVIESGAGTYWTGRNTIQFGDLTDAVRFARFSDAERVRCWLINKDNASLAAAVRSTEHVWIGGEAA
jgi:hypothetical protein